MSLASLFGIALPWLPTAAVTVLTAAAIAAARRPTSMTGAARWLRLVAVAALGFLAIAGTGWQAFEIGAATKALLPTRPSVGAEPNRAVIPDLKKQIESLKSQVNHLKHSTTTRSIGPEAAAKLADYLRQFGSHRVVVSCAPNDVEAFDYATQLADLLKSADWDAQGPEVTTIFGDVQAMGINVYGDAAQDGKTVEILLAGLAKFDIPFQTRVAPARALPDGAVELFVGAQPALRAAASAGQPSQ